MTSPIEKLPAVIKFANAEDEATGDAYEVFEFTKLLGRRGKVRIERDQARQAEKVFNILIRKNWDVPKDEVRAASVVAAAIRTAPQQYVLHARHLGWRRNRKAFVLQKKVVGAARSELKLKPPLWLNDRQLVVMRAKGDLQKLDKRDSASNALLQLGHADPIGRLRSAALTIRRSAIVRNQPFWPRKSRKDNLAARGEFNGWHREGVATAKLEHHGRVVSRDR